MVLHVLALVLVLARCEAVVALVVMVVVPLVGSRNAELMPLGARAAGLLASSAPSRHQRFFAREAQVPPAPTPAGLAECR